MNVVVSLTGVAQRHQMAVFSLVAHCALGLSAMVQERERAKMCLFKEMPMACKDLPWYSSVGKVLSLDCRVSWV